MLKFKGTMKDAHCGGREGVRRRVSVKFGLGSRVSEGRILNEGNLC